MVLLNCFLEIYSKLIKNYLKWVVEFIEKDILFQMFFFIKPDKSTKISVSNE